MSRPKNISQSELEEYRANIGRTTVMVCTVANYKNLAPLQGTVRDLEMMDDVFVSHPEVAIYSEQSVVLSDPTSDQFRQEILNYAVSRSAKGDILILYFSGHGAVLGSNEFGLCFKDTALGMEPGKALPLSVVRFKDVVQTLAAVDVFPVFIIDACFSGLAASQGITSVIANMQADLVQYFANSFALLASSNSDTTSFETLFGGYFTSVLYNLVMGGLNDEKGRQHPFITLENISKPIQEAMVKQGIPLPKIYVGGDFPKVPLARNVAFRPDTIKFSPYFKKIIEYLWNGGNPREVTKEEILQQVGRGAYGNHQKLSYAPWALLEDGEKPKTRRLTPKGLMFAQGKISIPKEIIRDPVTWSWVAAPNAEEIYFDDI